MNRQRSWPGDAGIEYYRLILLHILGRRDEFPEQEHEVDENEKEIFTMPGDAGDERLVLGNDTENHANRQQFRFRAASPPFIDAYLRTFPSSHRHPICTHSPDLFDSIFICFLTGI
jgi:hypothetical protein